jgi:hypothetical protein
MIMSCRFVVIAILALIMGAVGAEAATTRVKVVNGRGAPALVMDQTVLRPVHGNATVRLEAGPRFADLELFTPPTGQMVVIEYLTIQAFVEEPTANAFLELEGDLGEGGGIEHALEAFPPPIELGIGTVFQQTLTQHVLLYSTGTVVLSIDRGQENAKLGVFEVSFSGYLVKAPD